MNQSKKVWLLVPAVLLIIAVVYKLWQQQGTQKAIPSLLPRIAEVTASSEFLNAQKAVEYYRREIQKHPDIVQNYVQLAQLFLQVIRVTGNEAEYIPSAQYLLDEALRRDPQNFEALVNKASLVLSLHQFGEGKNLAKQAIARNPYSASAYGVLVDALVELGEYDAAVEASDRMLSLRPDLRSYARASYLRELYGDEKGAVEAMKLAADAGVPGIENRAWVLYNLGNLYLGQGKLDTAAYIYKGILEERPNYAYALNGLALVQEAKGDFESARNLLREAYESLPSHHFLEQLIDLSIAAGQPEKAQPLVQQVLDAYEQDKTFGANSDLEYATFCANLNIHLDEALERIKREYARRPNHIQVLDTYAWILFKRDRATEAVPLIQKALRLNTGRAELFYHAGMIYHTAGRTQDALPHLQRALISGAYLDAVKREEARRVLSSLQKSVASIH